MSDNGDLEKWNGSSPRKLLNFEQIYLLTPLF